MTAPQPKMGERLIAAGLLTPDLLEKGLALQREQGGYLIDVLFAHRLVDERKTLQFLAQASGAKFVTVDKLKAANIPSDVLDRIPARHAERMLVLPVAFNKPQNTLTVACAETDVVEAVRLAAGVGTVVPVLATRAALRAAIKRYYFGDLYAFAAMDEPVVQAVVKPQPQTNVVARDQTLIMFRPGADAPQAPIPLTAAVGAVPAPAPQGELQVAQPVPTDTPVARPIALTSFPPAQKRSPLEAQVEQLAEDAAALASQLPAAPLPPAPREDSGVEVLAENSGLKPVPQPSGGEMELLAETSSVKRRPEGTSGDGVEVLAETSAVRKAPVTPPAAGDAGPNVSRLEVEARDAEIEKLKRELDVLRVQANLQGALALERDVSAILQRVLAFALDSLPSADDGVLLTIDRSGAVTPRGVRTRLTGAPPVVVSDALLDEVIASRSGVLASDATMDERLAGDASVTTSGVRSAMCAPLLLNGEVRGVLFFDTRTPGRALSEGDLRVLMTIALQASRALDLAEAFRRVATDTATRAHLGRFLSPALVEQAIAGEFEIEQSGLPLEVTVLKANVHHFGALAESLDPQHVVALLNEHFADMVDVVFQNGGVLDKFVGDSLIAVWGAPTTRESDASRATRAALQMVERVAQVNAHREAEGRPGFGLKVGLATGPVVFGAVGSPRRLELTAIGQAVNVAGYLCDEADPMQVVASDATIRKTFGSFVTKNLASSKLKNKPWKDLRAVEVKSERELG